MNVLPDPQQNQNNQQQQPRIDWVLQPPIVQLDLDPLDPTLELDHNDDEPLPPHPYDDLDPTNFVPVFEITSYKINWCSVMNKLENLITFKKSHSKRLSKRSYAIDQLVPYLLRDVPEYSGIRFISDEPCMMFSVYEGNLIFAFEQPWTEDRQEKIERLYSDFLSQFIDLIYNDVKTPEIDLIRTVGTHPEYVWFIRKPYSRRQRNEQQPPVCDLARVSPLRLRPVYPELVYKPIVLEPQSDSPTDSGEAGAETEVKPTFNVDLVENRGDLLGDPQVISIASPRLDAFSQPPESFSNLTSRWNNLGSFQWSTGDAVGTILHTIDLPLDILPSLENNPALLPALQFMFWRPQITTRFQLNSTRFHSGGLIVGVQYYSGPNPKTGQRRIVHSNQLWQLDYATLRASSSNIAELAIPFKSFLDALPIRGGSYGSSSYYATVYVGVIGGLGIGMDGSQTVNVTTQVKLECLDTPTEFYSQFSRMNLLTPQGNTVSNIANDVLSIAKPIADIAAPFIPGASLVTETLSIANGLVENVVKPIENLFGGAGRSFPASNMDKVSLPIDASPLIQYPTASLSWGEGPTPGRAFRLNPAMTTPHHPQTTPLGSDLLTVKDLALKWSFLDRFTIQTSSNTGTLLWSTPITPISSPQTGPGYLPTALAGVSSQFTYWSGQLEYKFIALKADPHSFRLRFASNPTSEFTHDKQVDLPSEVVDFQEINEFTLIPPYFGPTHLTPTTYAGQACALGCVQVSLENPLVSINSCSSEIDVIVLVRAHDNFELSIPRSTLYLPNITTETVDPPAPDVINNVVTVIGTLYVRLYHPDQYGFRLIADGPVSKLVDQKYMVFGKPTEKTVYLFETDPNWLPDKILTSNAFDAGSLVFAPTPDVSVQTDNKYDVIDLRDNRKYTRISSPYPYPITLSLPDKVRVLEPQSATEREETVLTDGPPSTVRGSQTQLILGETTTLRSSLRRYNVELGGIFNPDTTGTYELVVDVNFGALSARTAGTPVSNLTFNHDAFRFSKGGLSYIFNIRNAYSSTTKVKAMHIPGGLYNTYELRPTWKPAQYSADPSCYMYASDVVATPQTSVPIHIPYYNYTNLLVNSYDPSTSGYGAVAAYSMGKLVFSVDAYAGEAFSWELLRALGDDADMYCFQGWPICTQDLKVKQMNTISLLKRTNLHSILVEPYPKSLEPQSESQNDSAPDFPKIPAVSKESEVISNFITEFSNTRRGRRALKNFLSRISILTPQNQSELSPGNHLIMEQFLQELIVCYKQHKPVKTIIPPFALHFLNPSDVEQARAEWHDDDNLQRRKVLNSIVNSLAGAFSNFDAKRYYLETGQETKTRTWTNSLIGALSATTGLIPQSLKTNLAMVGEIVKGNAFFQVIKALKETFSDLTNLNLVISCLQMILKATDLWVKSMALTMLLTHFGFLDSRQLGIAMLVNQLIYLVTPTKQTITIMGLPNLVPQSDDNSDVVAQWIAALMAGTAAVCGFKSAKTWSGGVESFMRNMGTVGNGIHRLLTTSCRVVLDYILWLIGMENPTTLAIAELKQINVEAADWAQQVLQLVDPSRRSEVLASPTLRAKVSELYAQGSVFIRVLIEDKSRPEATGTFLNIWRSLVELFGETGEMPDSVKANMPPLCIWINGKPGIGKSEVAKRVARDIALLLNISYDGDPFFVRTPRKYWDGYNAQPVIIFDDAMQIQSPEILSQFYSDWYGIMTNAPFSPEFSSISEKKKFVTPQIVVVCANSAYPKVEGIATPASFYRRRDFLLEAKLSDHIKTNYGNDIVGANDIRIPITELESFNHLRFGQYADATNSKSAITGCWTVTELVKEMKPRIEHLVKIRTSSAEKNVEASRSLRADTIEAARGVLLKELEALNVADNVVGNLTKAYSEVTGEKPSVVNGQSDTSETEHTGRMWDAGPKSSKMCLFGCEKIAKEKLKCFCDIPESDFKNSEYCTMHGCFIIRNKNLSHGMGLMASAMTKPSYALGFFQGCKKDTKRKNFDKVLTQAINNIDVLGLSNKIPLPPFMDHTIHPPPQIDPIVFEEVQQVSTWLAMKQKLKIWLQIGMKFLVPLVLGFGILFACRLFDIFGKIKDFFSPESQTPPPKIDSTQVLTPLPQLASSGSVSTRGTPSVKHVLRAVTAQMSSEDVTRMILKNKVKWTVTYEDGVRKSVFGLGIFGRHIVLPHHVFTQYDRKTLLWQLTLFPKNCEPKTFDFEDASCFVFQQINGTDLALLEILPRRIPMFKDITKTFLRKEDLGKVTRSGMLIDITADQATIVPLAIKPEEFVSQYNFAHGVQTVAMVGYSYPYERSGLCGSILVDSYHGWIIGMHVAGQSGTGYSNILSSVFFQNMVRPVKDVLEPELEKGGIVELEGNFLPLGKVLDAQAYSLPLRTSIQKSICHRILAPPVRYPVTMTTPGEPKPGLTKLKVALEKGGIPTRVWPQSHVDKAKSVLIQRILAYCPPVTSAVGRRTFEEAICGVSNVPYANPLKRTSSVGWPLCTLNKGTKKGDFVKFEDTSDGLKIVGVSPYLVDDYNRMHALRTNGIVPWSPFLNFLKDERLKPGKNPRLINGSSFSQTIDTRRYSLDFVCALQNNALDVGIGIGINVHGFQWSDLARRLLSISDNVCCGDYSGFGPGLDTELVYCAYEVINAWYEKYQTENRERLQEDHTVRLTLAENLAFSCELSLDTMIKTLQGSPSGNDLTAVINSLVNHLMLMLVWQRAFDGTTIQEPSFFYQLCYPVVYGDDLIMSVHDSIIEQFNNETLQKIFSEIGVKYTDADKTGNIRRWCPLSEASFLKCSFLDHPTRGFGTYLGALDKDVIEDIPNWVHASADPESAAFENCLQACRFAYAWGEDYYHLVQCKLTEFWCSRGRAFPQESWEYLDSLFFGELRGVALPKSIDPRNYTWA